MEEVKSQLETEIKVLEDNLKNLSRYPEDDFEDGTVIQFEKVFPHDTTVYSYAAIKAQGRWYTTGPRSPKSYTWIELVKWMDDVKEVWVVSEYERIV